MIRKLLALFAPLLLIASPAWAAPTLAWKLAAMVPVLSASTCAVAVPGGQSAAVGDELLVFIALQAQTQTVNPPSSTGVTWSTGASSCTNVGGSEEVCGFTGTVTGTQAAATSYTFTDATASDIIVCDMFDVSGTNNTVDYRQGNQGTGGSTTMTVTPTLSTANDFVAVFMFNYNVTQYTSVTQGAGWTGTPSNANNSFDAAHYGAADMYNVQTASGSPGLVISWATSTWTDCVVIAMQPGAVSGMRGFIWW